MKNEEIRRALIAGIVAAIAISCGGPAMEMMSDAMLSDAGVDTSDIGIDAVADAEAQPECGDCTTGGALRIVTADTDITRIVSGVQQPGFGGWEEIVVGPFIVTDIQRPSSLNVDIEIGVTGTGCAGRTPFPPGDIQDGSWAIPEGRSLCMEVTGTTAVHWSGYHPYD